MPIAAEDSAYVTPVNTALNVSGSASLLQNDWDPDGGTLGATIVTNPSHGVHRIARNGISRKGAKVGQQGFRHNTESTQLV